MNDERGTINEEGRGEIKVGSNEEKVEKEDERGTISVSDNFESTG